MRWANETKWDSAIQTAAGNYGIPADLIRAVIATESQFTPNVSRNEPAIKDASIGLMQILYGTAQGEGYTGPVGDAKALSGLYDPFTNITYGASYLAEQYNRAGRDVARAFSAYNGGWRPELGFGTKATKPLTICLARDTTTGKCIRTRAVKVGEFGNQPYVDAAMANYDYFLSKAGGIPPLPSAGQYEPQTDRRVGGAVNRPTRITLWEAIIAWLRAWFLRRR